MEPPAKRPRLGISPLKPNQEDVDDDELNLQPEQVNALRDPGYQLERARSFAANKLKSAFERIFEKYERDFTGIGDEINLTTGEVEVDNGHIQSLQYADLGQEDADEDGDDDDDDDDDDESIDEEERLLQGKPNNEKRLSSVGGSQNSGLTSLKQPLGQPQPWSGTQLGMAGPPRISSLFGPPMPFGSFSTSRNVPGGMDTRVHSAWSAPQLPAVEKYIDPAWRAPELPPPKPEGPRFASVKKKLLPAHTGRSGGHQDEDEDEDDILTGVSVPSMTKSNSEVKRKKMKLLLPPNPVQGSSSTNHGMAPKSTPKRKEGNGPKPKESTGKQKAATKSSKGDISANRSPKSQASLKECTQMKENWRMDSNAISIKQVVAVKSKKPSKILPTVRGEATDEPDTGLYINHSCPGNSIPITKPINQKLSIEIVVRRKIDKALYQVVPTDFSPTLDAARPAEDRQFQGVEHPPVSVSERSHPSTEGMGKEKRTQKSVARKKFARNTIDSSFAFSDDDEPALPKTKRRKQPSAARKEKRRSGGHHDIPSLSERLEVAGLEAIGTTGLKPALNGHPEVLEEKGGKHPLVSQETRKDKADQGVSGGVEPQETVIEEVYTRNVIDPGFHFSDEDEAALPKTEIRGGAKVTNKNVENAVQKVALDDEAALRQAEVPSTEPEDPNGEQRGVIEESVEPQPIYEENNLSHKQDTITGDLLSEHPKQGNDSEAVVPTVKDVVPLAPVEISEDLPAPEANIAGNEQPVALDTTQQSELTLHIDGSGPTVTGPGEIIEPYPQRLLQMKPRRKRKISAAFTEDSMLSPVIAEGEKRTETFITAPSKRFKRPKQTHLNQVSDLGGQREEQTMQLEPETEQVTKDDAKLPDARPTSPSAAAEDLAIPESPQPAETETATAVDLTIPESPPLVQPEFRSSLLGIVGEEDLAFQLDDAEPDLDIDFDSPPEHPPTPLPDLPSPELGEDLNVPETSPLPYSSPSKAVKAVKKGPKTKPPQPATPVKNRGKGRQKPPQRLQEKKDKLQNAAETKIPPHPPSSSGLSSRTKGILSLVSDDEGDESDELSLTPGHSHGHGPRPRYYTPPNVRGHSDNDPIKHTSLTGPLMRMKLLSSSKKKQGIVNNPKTPSQRRMLMSTAVNDENHRPHGTTRRGAPAIIPPSSVPSKMYFSADRRTSTSSSGAVIINSSGGGGRGRGIKRRRSALSGNSRLAATPVIPEFVDESVVETPGGTKRRCGEDGFHCDRDFCFVCL